VASCLSALSRVTREFQAAGVRVLWGYQPWEQHLRPEGEPAWTTLAKLLNLTGADGFNGDTMDTMPFEFWQAGIQSGHKIVGEMEGGGYPHAKGWPTDKTFNSLNWDTIGWGYYHYGSGPDNITDVFWDEPGIDRAKWLDPTGRRQTHVCDRWAKDRHDAMQFAHFNGVGYESWEDVWGIWMHFSARDGEALRRLQPVWKWLGGIELTQGYEEWRPYAEEVAPAGKATGIYASRWVHGQHCAWTVVNRGKVQQSFSINTSSAACSGRFWDLFSGSEVSPTSLTLAAEGYAAYYMAPEAAPGLQQLLATMRQLTQRPLESYSKQWSPQAQQMEDPGTPPPATAAPKGMVEIPRTKFLFQTGGREIEGGCDVTEDFGTGNCCPGSHICPGDPLCDDQCAFAGADDRGIDVQYWWDSRPKRFHSAKLDVGPFFIDRSVVTKSEYASYLSTSSYQPRDPTNFLKDWAHGRPRKGDEDRPVTWVSLQDAREYCRYFGKRLPHAYEWQLAAQGTDGRQYPWGNEMDWARIPPVQRNGTEVMLPKVLHHRTSDSVFNVSDTVGVVWQFTDVFNDPHTRGVVVKGSSNFNPILSGDFPALPQVGNWYFPPARKLTQHNRILLMDESIDRAGTVGFRCVASHPEGAPGPRHVHETVADDGVSYLI